MKEGKYGLAIHTSTRQLGLGLIDCNKEIRSEIWDLDRALLNNLHQHLKEFLGQQSWQDLAFIAVAKGPGSFTSIRIGMVTARILAQQLKIPLLSISTLAALAQHKLDQSLMAIQLTASSGQYYVGIYEKSLETGMLIPILPDQMMEFHQWQKILTELEKPYLLVEGETKLGYTVESLLSLAFDLWSQGNESDWSEVLPFYLNNP